MQECINGRSGYGRIISADRYCRQLDSTEAKDLPGPIRSQAGQRLPRGRHIFTAWKQEIVRVGRGREHAKLSEPGIRVYYQKLVRLQASCSVPDDLNKVEPAPEPSQKRSSPAVFELCGTEPGVAAKDLLDLDSAGQRQSGGGELLL